ncbi:MAG: substrate-binding domain-containing protein [Firmicutes bacterium]|nr:substrate-binding domain-containing protein [Bacillota bacterium]
MSKKKVLLLALAVILIFSVAACSPKEEPDTGQEPENGQEKIGGEIILSTTTSTQDSGLLDFLLPEFKNDTGIEVKVIAVGTGQALQMGRDGEADVLLVHAKASELEFLEEGAGTERHDVMYNDFILVGPTGDTMVEKGDNIEKALSTIKEKELVFVSRGDDSGTHKKELAIWKAVNIEPAGEWYLDAGAGMGAVLTMANEKEAYTITDRATYLSMKNDLDLEIVIEGDENLLNQYGVIPVNPEVLGDKADQINHEGALEFMNWLISERGQELISKFGVEEYGQALFVPNAN